MESMDFILDLMRDLHLEDRDETEESSQREIDDQPMVKVRIHDCLGEVKILRYVTYTPMWIPIDWDDTEYFSQREIDDLSTDELKIHDDLSDMPMWGLTDSDDTEDFLQREFDPLKVDLKKVYDRYLRDLDYFSQRMPRKNYDQQTESKDRERDISKRNRVSTGEYLNHRVPFYMKAVLFGIIFLASRFGSILTYADFIPIRPNSNFCNIDYSKLPSTCDSDKTLAFHCVYDSDGQLGICCAEKMWIPRGNCPFFSKAFGVLDYQPCFAEACPNDKDWYMSDEASMYPGCLSNNFSSVAQEILVTETTTQTRQSVTDCFNSHETNIAIGLFVLIACVGCAVVLSLVYLWNNRKARRERSHPEANNKSTAMEMSIYPEELQRLNSSDSRTTTTKKRRRNMTL